MHRSVHRFVSFTCQIPATSQFRRLSESVHRIWFISCESSRVEHTRSQFRQPVAAFLLDFLNFELFWYPHISLSCSMMRIINARSNTFAFTECRETIKCSSVYTRTVSLGDLQGHTARLLHSMSLAWNITSGLARWLKHRDKLWCARILIILWYLRTPN